MLDGGFVNLRDFVYLDVERVKSLLAQLDRGLLSERSDASGSTTSVDAKAGFSIPALFEAGGGGQYVSTNDATETRTLHDFVYNQTEEKLLELRRIRSLAADFMGSQLLDDEVRASLSPVEYVLIRGRIEISDYNFMLEILRSFNEIRGILTEFSFQDKLSDASPGKERDAVNREMTKAIVDGKLDDKYIKKLVRLFEFFLTDRLVVKIFPFPENPNIRIVGPLQFSLLRERLEDIRFKFGSFPAAEWTMFGQVAAVPQQNEARPTFNLEFSNQMDDALEDLFDSMRGIEDFFRVTFPEIAVTPIAIYRD